MRPGPPPRRAPPPRRSLSGRDRPPSPLLLSLLAIVALAGCGDNEPPAWREEGSHRWRPLEVERGEGPGFTSLSPSRTGVDFSNSVTTEQISHNEHVLLGSGAALGDVDGDGRVDIYLARMDGPNALYRNLGEWRFEEVTEKAGVAARGRLSTGAALADVDGDGDLDLLVTALGGPNSLYLNEGEGRFVDATEEAGLASDRGSTTMTLADVEGDGDLDLYVANYKAVSAEDLFPPWTRSYHDIIRETEDGPEVAPEFREHYRVVVLPEHDIVAYVQRADPDWFYLNDGTGSFEPVSWTSGRFVDEEGDSLEEPPDYFGLSARFQDVDGDGDPDLYVCNDFEDPDSFWINRGDGRFRAIPRVAVRATSNACMAVDFGDIDRDGHVDWFELDMLSRDPVRRRTMRPSHTALPKLVGRIENRPQKQRNTLFLNRGDRTFAQIAEYAGVEASEWSWSTLLMDVDLDGYEDILVANGHELNVQDLDANRLADRAYRRARSRRSEEAWREIRFLYPDYYTPNVAFRNEGDRTFEEVGEEWGFALGPDVSHGMAAGDLDGDGDRDVVVNRLGSPAALLRNDAGGRRLAVRLRGEPPNTRGVGSTIRVLGGAVPEQRREVTAGGLYLSSSDPLSTFAAGGAEELTVAVEWRSGKRSVLRGVRPGRLYEIREAAARDPAEAPLPSPPDRGPGAEAAGREGKGPAIEEGRAPLFRDVTGSLGHTHTDSLFDDFARQPLLPNRLSQLGPGISWIDVDGDGDEDLVVPSGRGGRLALYRNDGGTLVRERLEVTEARRDQTTVLGLPRRGDAGADLLVGVSGYEAGSRASADSVPGAVRLVPRRGPGAGSLGREVAAPGGRSATGPLALADYDGDGDLDLFVGGRVVPGDYPAPASSRLYRNEGGRFRPDPENRDVLASVGLVSAAVFSDVDGDGDPDLLLAREWGPVALLVNEEGSFREAGESWGLDRHRGRWNGVTTGDLDGDGRLDVVATNWGRNTRFRPEPDRPLHAFYGDFDRNRSTDVLLAQSRDRGAGEALYPLAHTRELIEGLPSVPSRFSGYSDLARAPVAEVAGRPIGETSRVTADTYRHTLFLNRGGSFEAVPLPAEAQLAPAFAAGVADVDGDGNEDVLLSQNFFPTATQTPRYDAGRALLLLGDGAGGLRPVPGQRSGIAVYGDQRGAAFADYDADGRVDVAISQNGAATKLYRNVGAAPGLRVRLEGPPANPRGVGAVLRLVYPDRLGPAREVHAGSGYWSQDGAVQVLGGREGATAVRVRWPDGAESVAPFAPGDREVTVRRAAASGRR